jgi:hypothetical protein
MEIRAAPRELTEISCGDVPTASVVVEPAADCSACADGPDSMYNNAINSHPMVEVRNTMNAPALFQRRDLRPGGHLQ